MTPDDPPRIEICEGCHAVLPPIDGPTHRYIGASPACWDRHGRLMVGQPVIENSRLQPLLVDAYAAQHPGGDSSQATQSVAVHLITLEVILEGDAAIEHAVALRVESVEVGRESGYPKIDPPPAWELTIHEIVEETHPARRGELTDRYVRAVWSTWKNLHFELMTVWSQKVTHRLHLWWGLPRRRCGPHDRVAA